MASPMMLKRDATRALKRARDINAIKERAQLAEVCVNINTNPTVPLQIKSLSTLLMEYGRAFAAIIFTLLSVVKLASNLQEWSVAEKNVENVYYLICRMHNE